MAWYKGYLTKQEMDTLGWSYDPFQGRKPLKNELEDELVRDPDVISMTQQYTYYTELAGFLDAAVSHIQWRHQTIRNMIDWRKFEAGE